MLLLLSLSPDASIKNTLMTGASSVRELSTHQLINSPKKAELLCLSVLSYSLGSSASCFLLWPEEQSGEITVGGCGASGFRSCFCFSSQERPSLKKSYSFHYFSLPQKQGSSSFFHQFFFFFNSTLKKNNPYLNRLEPSNGITMFFFPHFISCIVELSFFSWIQNVKSLVQVNNTMFLPSSAVCWTPLLGALIDTPQSSVCRRTETKQEAFPSPLSCLQPLSPSLSLRGQIWNSC